MSTLTTAIVLAIGSTTLQASNELTVTGYGKVFYDVDTADLEFSLSVRDADAKACKKRHDELVSNVSDYFTQNGYPLDLLSLRNSSLTRHYDQKHKTTSYIATSLYTLRTTRIDTVTVLQADLVIMGVDEIQKVHFFSSQQRDFEDNARRLAIDDAKRKARLTAEELDWTLGRATEVQYVNSSRHHPAGHGSRASLAGQVHDAGPLSADFVDVTVQISFLYDWRPASEIP